MDLEVVIEGVADAHVEKAIKQKIHDVCAGGGHSGWCSVLLTPSETRGMWDVGVRDTEGSRVATFADGGGELPELVAAQLRACL